MTRPAGSRITQLTHTKSDDRLIQAFTYDKAGNRTRVVEADGTVIYTVYTIARLRKLGSRDTFDLRNGANMPPNPVARNNPCKGV